jgi:hypothetical protein
MHGLCTFRLWPRFAAEPCVRYGQVTRRELIQKNHSPGKEFSRPGSALPDSGDQGRVQPGQSCTDFEKFFVFFIHDGVKPANSLAERALRFLVNNAGRRAMAQDQFRKSQRRRRSRRG